MASNTETISATVDVDALAAAIAGNVLRNAAENLVLTCDWLADDGRGLNQRQKIEAAFATPRVFDGTEATIRDELYRAIPADPRWVPTGAA